MSITIETTRRLAHLARIHLSEREQSDLTHDMQGILHFVDQLMNVDLAALRPHAPPSTLQSILMEEDVVREGENPDAILSQTSQHACGMFVVPKMVE